MEVSAMDLERNRAHSRAGMERLLRPRSVALIGASSTPGSLSDCVLTNLEDSGYSGEVFLVNPKRPLIRGRQSLGSIADLPEGVDCAILAIPGAAVVENVRACAQKRVGSAIVFSAGFAESGEAGAEAQRELARIARESGMVLEGPNCLGMVNYLDGVPLTFVMTPPQPVVEIAGAAILSQSGALAAVIAVNMRHYRIPLTFSISTGNEATDGIEDFIDFLLGDERIRVFALVVEQFRDPARFLDLARRAREANKFIVLLHPGRSNAARVSAATHTGALAGEYEVMQTLVKRAGVIHVEHLEELVDVTQVLVRCLAVPVGGAAVFTESGAFKALALDLCESVGLPLPALSLAADQALRQALPPFIPSANPLDLTAQGLVDPDLYRRTLPPVLADENFGSVVLAIILTDARTTRLKLPPIVDALMKLRPDKAVVFAALDEGAPFDFPELDQLRSLGVPCFPSSERALRALARLSNRAADALPATDAVPKFAAVPQRRSGVLSEWESKRILESLGIPVPAGGVARNPAEAQRIAAEIGYPVVLKAHSALLLHKTDAGGVLLGIDSDAALLRAWSALHENVRAAQPDLVLDGVLVERMCGRGMELIVGGKRDPQWGPVLLAGFGGVFAEAVSDRRLLAPDLSPAEIECELEKLRCGRLLHGFRGAPPLDTAAVARVIATIGAWMRLDPGVREIDVNPLVVFDRGKGVLALDALVSITDEERREGWAL